MIEMMVVMSVMLVAVSIFYQMMLATARLRTINHENAIAIEGARAIVEAALRRLRPILLTTATTVVGLIPLWLGGGPMFSPMAVAILFGLLFATGLTLGVVPLMYSLLFRVRFKDFRYE